MKLESFLAWLVPWTSGLTLGILLMLVRTDEPQTLPACQYEDSVNCVWNAQTQGNGKGASFVNLDGTIYREVSR